MGNTLSELAHFGNYNSESKTVKVKCENCEQTYCEIDGKLWSQWGNVYQKVGRCKQCAGYGAFEMHPGDAGGDPWRNKKGEAKLQCIVCNRTYGAITWTRWYKRGTPESDYFHGYCVACNHTPSPCQSKHYEQETKHEIKEKHGDETVKSLLLMGFDESLCLEAVDQCNNDLNSCVDYIVSPTSQTPKNDEAKNGESKVGAWLKSIDMMLYFRHFVENGYDKLFIVATMNDTDLIEIGVDKKGHRKQILLKIQKMFEGKDAEQTILLYK